MAYIGNTQLNQNYVPAVDFFSGNGSTTAFTLSRPVASVAAIQAVISNVPQDPGTAFTVSGSTITFTSAPPSGTNNVYVYYTSPNTSVATLAQSPVITGNLNMGSTGARITGDFSNATIANRVALKSSTVNGNTIIPIIPNGTATTAGVNVYNSTDPDNSGTFGLINLSTDSRLISSQNGTGSFVPMTFYTGGSERMRIDTSGNVGIGTSSPSADYFGTARLLQISGSAAAAIKFERTSATARKWEIGVTTGGNFDFVDTVASTSNFRMRIDTSGNLQFNSGYGSAATAYGCRAWVNFNGTGTVAIRASGNVTSITDNGTGDYTVNFTNAMPDVNYGVSFANNNNNAGVLFVISSTNASSAPTTMSTTQLRIYSQYDVNVASVSIFR